MRDITDDEFSAVTTSGKVFVDFYTVHCPPCKVMAPILEKLSAELTDITFVKVNVDEHMLNASRLNIGSVPTFVLYEDGEETKRHLGTISERALKEWLGV